MSLRTRFARSLRHAFAVPSASTPLTDDDRAALEHLAAKVVARGMEAPMVLLLESISPINFLGSQALRVLSPVIDCVGHTEDVDRIARVLEKRDGIQQLITLIEAKSGAMSSTAPRRNG